MQGRDANKKSGTQTPIETSVRALQILHAADELMAEHGPDGVSMREVAERARVNKALIFYYYGSRAALIDKVLERYVSAHARTVSRAFGEAGTLRERIHRLIDTYLDFVEGHRLFARLVQRELARDSPELPQVKTCLDDFRATFTEVLPAAIQARPGWGDRLFATVATTLIAYGSPGGALGETAPLSREDHRAPIHWLADAALDRLEAEGAAG